MHWLRQWRKERNMTAAGLAKQVRRWGGGCSETLIDILEGGGVTHPEIAERIAAATCCTPAQRESIMPEKYRGMNRRQRRRLYAQQEEDRLDLLSAMRTVKRAKEPKKPGKEQKKPGKGPEKPAKDKPEQSNTRAIVKIGRDGRELARYRSTSEAAIANDVEPKTIRYKCQRREAGAQSSFVRHGATWLYAKEWDEMDACARSQYVYIPKGRRRKNAE